MSSIRPPGGWDPTPLAQQAGLARPDQPSYPRYVFDPSARHIPRESFINDLRAMGGREARQLTFGATFGATSGFLMARFLVGALKFALVLVAIAILFFAIALRQTPGSAPAPVHPAATQERIVRVEPAEESYAHQLQRLQQERDAAALDLSAELEAIKQTLSRGGAYPGSLEMQVNMADLPDGEYQRCETKLQKLTLSEALLANVAGRDPQFADPDVCLIARR